MIKFKISKLNFKSYYKSFYVWYKKKPAIMTSALFIVLIFSLFLYISQINDMATKGHQVKELEKKLAELQKQEYNYTVQVAELRSMQRIEKGIEALNLVKSDKKDHIEVNNGPIVARR